MKRKETKNLNLKYKVYSVGMGDGDWIKDSNETTWEESNIVVFPGGADINPAIYKEEIGRHTHFYEANDERHMHYYKEAIKDGKYIIGICRGAQLMCAMQNDMGGKLIQHVTGHSGNHDIDTFDGQVLHTNSIHHQMLYPWNMPSDSYKVLGWTKELSRCHLDGNNEQNVFPKHALIEGSIIEPEIVWFPNIRGLAIQFHPEMMGYNYSGYYTKTLDYLNNIINNTFENNDYFKLKKEEIQAFNNVE